ncbi:hypothetical protein WIMU106979_22755 [Williamsia muralis]
MGSGAEGVVTGSSSTWMPKAFASPASPSSYPCPTARTFHASPRRYTSMHTTAASVVRRAGVNDTDGTPAPSRSSARSVPAVAKVVGPLPSRLAVMAIVSMSAGTRPVSMLMTSDAPASR